MSDFTSPAVQAMNLIRYIGDQVSQSGKLIPGLSSEVVRDEIGAPSWEFAQEIIEELDKTGIIKFAYKSQEPASIPTTFFHVSLTLAGWEQYEAEKRGKFQGNYGFIAMQFGDSELDPFVKNVVKPAVKESLGYDLVDMDDAARAGVIDNNMRTQIRDAAFLIVDLTHDNSGAYWEAGYGEGLGKPVIYICEKAKFDLKKTHFDTNHCTTVPWSKDDADGFRKKLIGTLRRSLDL